jgi:hypothetical protein
LTDWLHVTSALTLLLYIFTWATSTKVVGDSRLSRKYQATVPTHVRSLLKLDAGDLILFVRQNREVILKKGELRIKR